MFEEKDKKKKILFLANHDITLYNYRLETVQRFLKESHRVIFSTPYGEKTDDLINLGCEFEKVELSRRGINPFQDLKLLFNYIKIIRRIKPDIVFSYTIKSNVYGGIACGLLKIPYVINMTGMGTSIANGGLMQKITLFLYKLGCQKAKKVFFQNSTNQKFMLDKKIVTCNNELLPGSGVNLKKHCFEEYPSTEEKVIILVIGRVMKDKGINEILWAAETIKKEHKNVIFRIIGSCENEYIEKLKQAGAEGYVEYLGARDDIHSLIKESHATLHASYHEGMANVLLETAACGRPVIATDVPGCRETYDDGISGIAFKAKDKHDLARAVEDFLALPYEKKVEMGKNGRAKVEKEFDREVVVQKYVEVLKNI